MSKRRQVLINLGSLSPREKENCVRMLSEKNVKFNQAGNGEFQATIIVQHPNTQSQVAISNRKTPRSITPTKALAPLENSYAGKKPLNEVVNMTAYPRLLSLCKYVEVYICPKRIPQRTLVDLTECLLHLYFRKHRFEEMLRSEESLNEKQSFPEFVFEELSRREKQSVKVQQLLVNFVESLNHFHGKIAGVKVFTEFLSESYRLQELVFFYFLRKMLEDLTQCKIVERDRLKTDLNQLQVEEEHVWVILSSFCHNHEQSHAEFEKIKVCMHYDSKRRKNVIAGYDLLTIFLESFRSNQKHLPEQESAEEEHSYQRPKLVEAGRDTLDKYGTKELNELLDCEEPSESPAKDRFTPEQNVVFLACLQALKEMCNRVNTPLSFYDRFSQLISHLLQCIFQRDKMSWFRRIDLPPTNGRLYYIESLQRQYEEMTKCSALVEELFLSKFIKKVLQAPGFYEAYAKLLLL